ncbi:uncharacterized protein LOC119368656 [Triticum dicoccoides]|uniref:uncharacterized protein LOC119368656 n=1 Tax=Triticum dicoccoides TaxID=85692 RepID=UPI00188EC98F|nr:uncharacterized protein LOC119368656 [Triticum dicoccoides]
MRNHKGWSKNSRRDKVIFLFLSRAVPDGDFSRNRQRAGDGRRRGHGAGGRGARPWCGARRRAGGRVRGASGWHDQGPRLSLDRGSGPWPLLTEPRTPVEGGSTRPRSRRRGLCHAAMMQAAAAQSSSYLRGPTIGQIRTTTNVLVEKKFSSSSTFDFPLMEFTGVENRWSCRRSPPRALQFVWAPPTSGTAVTPTTARQRAPRVGGACRILPSAMDFVRLSRAILWPISSAG